MSTTTVLHIFDPACPMAVRRLIVHLARAGDGPGAMPAQMLAIGADDLSRDVAGLVDLAAGADVVVSHLAPHWRALPGLMALRLARPDRPLIHLAHAAAAPDAPQPAALRRAYGALFDTVIARDATIARALHAADAVLPDLLRILPEARLATLTERRTGARNAPAEAQQRALAAAWSQILARTLAAARASAAPAPAVTRAA
jgi:hypothetical protein